MKLTDQQKKYKKKWYYKYKWRNETAPKCRERAGQECELCGMSNEQHNFKNGCNLNVHHIIKRKYFIPAMESDKHDPSNIRAKANNQANLVSLCATCHKKKIEVLSISEQCKLLNRRDPRLRINLPELVKEQLPEY